MCVCVLCFSRDWWSCTTNWFIVDSFALYTHAGMSTNKVSHLQYNGLPLSISVVRVLPRGTLCSVYWQWNRSSITQHLLENVFFLPFLYCLDRSWKQTTKKEWEKMAKKAVWVELARVKSWINKWKELCTFIFMS